MGNSIYFICYKNNFNTKYIDDGDHFKAKIPETMS